MVNHVSIALGSEPLLRASNLCKSFAGVQALQDVSFDIPARGIYGIIGPNGAGKTTLFNILTGLVRADAGEIRFNGSNIVNQPPHCIVAQGMARTFQNIRLFSNMSTLENIMVGRHIRSTTEVFGAIFRNNRARSEEHAIRERAQELLNYVGLKNTGNKQAQELSYGDQRRLEIARALATEPKLLALDEPAAGMNPTETKQLQILLEKLRDDGINILLIEHDMKLMMNLCDRILVLDCGFRIAEDVPVAIQHNTKVIEAYLGISA
jgi:branched-chain amino acid transport system ATP-binding protein